jgi:hypothetical protein
MEQPNKLYRDIEEIIVHWKKFNPIRCHMLGIHDFDGLLPDYSPNSIQNRISELKEDIVHLISLKRDYTDPYEGDPDPYLLFEFNLVKLTLEQELYELDVQKEYEKNPFIYIRPLYLMESSFLLRSFTSVEKRIDIIIKFLGNIPQFLSYPAENLLISLSDIHLDFSIHSLESLIRFYKTEIIKFVKTSNNIELTNKFEMNNKKVLEAMIKYRNALQLDYKPNQNKNYAIGEQDFLQMLKKREFVTISYDHLKNIGEKELEKNFSALKMVLSNHDENYLDKIQNDFPEPDQLIEYATSTLERTFKFVKERNIVTIPDDRQSKIIKTPESSRRIGFAGLNNPGPFEESENVESYYYITLPDKNWSKEQTNNYLKFFNKSSFEIITINQLWPGEHVKFLFEKYKTKSFISKLFSRASSIIEGYPAYIQEVMINCGYNPWPEEKDKIKVAHLLMSLLRNVRFIVAISIHCQGMTFEEAKLLFKEKSFLSEENAITETVRGVLNPMYLNYTLGKLLIEKLRKDYENELGNDFSLKLFHDELLSYGSPPITLLRQIMLKNEKLALEIL